jgi:hypothetical protein
MRKWVLPLLLFILLLIPFGVRAQTPVTVDSLQVQIWPEYDKPSVLVIYQMTLSANTVFPATISLQIPTTAGEPNAVAVRQVDGTLYSVDYTRLVSGEWATISFTTTTPEVQLEYYDPSLEIDGVARHYQYVWQGDDAVSQFIMQVQQPAGATDMRLSPSLGPGTTGADNLVYYTQDIGAIPASNHSPTIDYNKSTDTERRKPACRTQCPHPQSTVPDLSVSSWLPWILGILGAGLIIGGIIWFWQSGKQRPAKQLRRRRSKAGANESDQTASTTGDEIYCSQCGKRASAGDLFCRSCGTQIRNKYNMP